MNTFRIAEPVSIEEAVQLLDNGEETVRPISGGTALVLLLKSGLFQPDRLISLRRVNGLTGIEQANGELRVYLELMPLYGSGTYSFTLTSAILP